MKITETFIEKILKEGYGNTDKEKVLKAVKEIQSQGYPNPFNPREIIIQDKVGLEVSFFDGALWVSSITSFEQGGGRLGMEIILKTADKYQIIVRLDAEPFGKKTLNKSKLIAWYKRLGFKKASQGYERLPK